MALSSNSAVPAVQVCVEAPQETAVREVTLDGQEIYAPQLTMSDNLTRLAQRIDFGDQGERKTSATRNRNIADGTTPTPPNTHRQPLKCAFSKFVNQSLPTSL